MRKKDKHTVLEFFECCTPVGLAFVAMDGLGLPSVIIKEALDACCLLFVQHEDENSVLAGAMILL